MPADIKAYQPLDQINLTMTRHTSLLIDTWTSKSPQQTEDRFSKLSPIDQALKNLQPGLDLAVQFFDLGQVTAPQFGKLELWRDVVPQDRLKPAAP
jgi:hypothetical protein